MAGLDGEEVGEVPERRTNRATHEHQEHRHRPGPAGRPTLPDPPLSGARLTYLTTSTGSRITRPSVTSSSSSGRNARSCRPCRRSRWRRAGPRPGTGSGWCGCGGPPNPSMPWKTLAPANPTRCARCTISVYSGRWCYWSPPDEDRQSGGSSLQGHFLLLPARWTAAATRPRADTIPIHTARRPVSKVPKRYKKATGTSPAANSRRVSSM